MAAPRAFPLLVEGPWGPDPPKNLSTKLQMYLQSSKKSGGGECEVRAEPGTPRRFLVLFSQEDAQKRVLERENHELAWPGNGPFKLTLKLPTAKDESHDELNSEAHVKQPDVSEELDTTHSACRRSENTGDTSNQCLSSLVAFENLHTNENDMMCILVENISGLSRDDFQVEIIQDFEVAVVTFQKDIDIIKFIDDCTQHHIVKNLQLSPRLLEVTRTIRVENLPPTVSDQKLKDLFENPQNGGGRVVRVECFPEESSALIEFFEREVLDTILTKKVELDNMMLSVFPYYPSLGTALYGKEKPVIKLPAPFRESLHYLLWKFLQKKNHLIKEINDKMALCHCELTWSQLNGEVIIKPVAILLSQGRKKIKSWRQDASTAFSDLRSQYKVISFKVDPIMWDTIKENVEDDRLVIEFDTFMELVTLVGRSEDVEDFESQIKELIESTTLKIKREQQKLIEKLTFPPGKYSLLCESRALEQISTEFPEMEMVYDEASQHLCFKGIHADVYKVKCEIQERVYNMAQKNIQVPSEIFQFLQQVDCEEFSRSLFITQNILAVYELQPTTVLLTSCSSEVLVEAERQMMSALNFKRIEVEDRKVLDGKKWKRLTSSLQKQHNSSLKSVMIHELTSETTAVVTIAGCVREVNQVYSSLFDFLEKHTIIKKLIEVKPSIVFYYLKSEKKALCQQLKTKNVQVEFNPEGNPKTVLLTGPKSQIGEGMNLFKSARDSVCVRHVQIDKPGARQFFQEKPWFYKSEVKRQFGCFIELQENEEKEGRVSDGKKCHLKTDLAPGVSLIVQQGDLTRFPVDVVVNAASEDLKHHGGLAAALSKAAGPELQQDCEWIVKSQGKVLPGYATISKAGNLPYGHVIHAVVPKWERNKAKKCAYLLRRAVQESLHLAENHKYRSIAIPAISAGVCDFPLTLCMESIILAIKENYQFEWEGQSLKEIYLVDESEETVKAFAETVKTQFNLPGSASQSSVPTPVLPDLQHRNTPTLWTPRGLKVLMVESDVQDATTDLIVNSIPRGLELNRGPLSSAILKCAGPKLQEELERVGQAVSVDVGTILQTNGYNLPCRFVLHVVAPAWKNQSTSAHKIMEDIIRQCLEITESLSLKSITFPAIGTGNLGFPKKVFAELILSEVLKFSSKNQTTSLQEVHFLLHPNDHENIQAFLDVFSQRINENSSSVTIPHSSNTPDFYGAVSTPEMGVHEMKIGPIMFQVANGDIAKEEADVIVNSTARGFNFKAGVSKAILNGAGKEVEEECLLQAQQDNDDYIVTKGGLLKCKNIIHVIGDNEVKNSVSCVLQECEKRNYTSICLPAIGTGKANQNPTKVAEAIIDAIEDCVTKGSVQSVKNVKVVLFQPHLLNIFYDAMKKREAVHPSALKFVMSKFTSLWGFIRQFPKKKNCLVLEKKKELAVFQVCGDNVKHVENALKWIQDLIIREQFSYTNEDECIKDFDEMEGRELTALQDRLKVAISLDHTKPLIQVCGLAKDVMEARDKIEGMIKRIRSNKELEHRANCISDFVEWLYKDSNTFHCFDKMTTLHLEEERRAGKGKTDVKIKDENYTVDFTTNTATNANGVTLPVQRVQKAIDEIPSHWSDMKQQNVCVVDLPPSHPEYGIVAGEFNQTCSTFTIEKIERIQNLSLWNSYRTKKEAMSAKNNNVVNEKQLFHGTDEGSLPHVNANGFNRSYAGKNAVAYGRGTYFAVNASYSADDIYSVPNDKGKKHMYYVRVLTGFYTVGNHSLIAPPPKDPQNPTDLYDSVTDNVLNPNLFVVFYDYQAYPEYLITYRQ